MDQGWGVGVVFKRFFEGSCLIPSISPLSPLYFNEGRRHLNSVWRPYRLLGVTLPITIPIFPPMLSLARICVCKMGLDGRCRMPAGAVLVGGGS